MLTMDGHDATLDPSLAAWDAGLGLVFSQPKQPCHTGPLSTAPSTHQSPPSSQVDAALHHLQACTHDLRALPWNHQHKEVLWCLLLNNGVAAAGGHNCACYASMMPATVHPR